MKTSTTILFLILSLGFTADSWASCKKVAGQWVDEDGNSCDPNQDNAIITNADGSQSPSLYVHDGSQTAATPTNTTPVAAEKKDVNKTAINNSGGGGCDTGRFGGASCETTNNINMGIGVANKLYQAVGQAAVQNRGTDAMNILNSKGINVTGADYLEGQAKTADAAQKANRNAGLLQTVNAGVQGWRAAAHKNSVKEIQKQAESALTACSGDAACKAEVVSKRDGEIKAQKNKALETTVAAALTAEQAGASLMQARMAKKTAEELRKRAGMGTGGEGQFNMNQQTLLGQDNGELTPTPTIEENAVVSNDPGGMGLDGGIKDFNPNIGNNDTMGPTPGAFQEAAAGKAGGGQGAGLGGSGGTSASKGDGGEGKSEAGPGKGQTGGQYATGDGGSPKFSRGSGSGAGVGVDSSFADMLKKMLPGGDEEKKESHASLDIDQDRGPATDQAAVIGRNKNIFFEISKRYQKKNNEGAVIFQ